MVSFGDVAGIVRPLVRASANFMAALEQRERGGSGASMFVRAGSDLIEAASKIEDLLSRNTSEGRSLAPARPLRGNLSGVWQCRERGGTPIQIYHSDDLGIIALDDGPHRFFGSTAHGVAGTQFVVTHTTARTKFLWHGVGSDTQMATTLWDWDARDPHDIGFFRR